MEKYGRVGHATHDNMAHKHSMLDNYGYKHKLRIRNIYCLSMAKMFTRTRLHVTYIGLHTSPVLFRLYVHLVTYLLIPWSRVVLEKLTGSKLGKKFPAVYRTRSFITAFTSVRHLSLSRACSIQSIPPHPTT